MMVAPEKALMPLSCFCSGLTTISSVSWMASTTSPNWRSSACSTTMLIDVVVRADRLDLELPAQVDQGQQVAPQPVHRRPVNLLDAALGLLAFEPDQLQQADLGDRVAVAADGDRQGRDDGQRERDLHLDGGAPPGAALDVHRAADLLDVGPYHVHANAATGEMRHPVRRREPGQENEIDELALTEPGGLLGCDELGVMAFSRTRCGSIPLPSSLISMMTLPPSWNACKSSRPSAGLPRRQPLVGRLHAVVDRIAQQMGQRVADGLDDRLVQLGLLPFQLDAGLLAASDRQVADHAGELVPDVADRLHARLHDVDLQLGGQQVEPLHGAQERGVLLGSAVLHDLVPRQDELADQGHELVEQADVDADGAVGDGRRCAAPSAPGRTARLARAEG